MPEYTLKNVIFPTKGSAIVLNTNADRIHLLIFLIQQFSSLPASLALTMDKSAGEGKYSIIASIMDLTLQIVYCSSTNKQVLRTFNIPCRNPLLISSWVPSENIFQ